MKLLLATRSAGKLRELRCMTRDSELEWVGLDAFPHVAEAVEDGDTFLANATKKALHYAASTGLPALADDSGLVVDALAGAPGVHSAYYAGLPRDDAANNRKLIEDLVDVPAERRTARFCCVMVFVSGRQIIATAQGHLAGRILDVARGAGGFGYDPYFFVPDLGRTTAEIEPDTKNAVSHRGHALRAILPHVDAFAHSTGV